MVDKIEIDYCCSWCGYKFKQKVGKSGGESKNGRIKQVSDQVKCPSCGNFLKTWG